MPTLQGRLGRRGEKFGQTKPAKDASARFWHVLQRNWRGCRADGKNLDSWSFLGPILSLFFSVKA